MIKDKKIFDAMTMALEGDKVRVLTTPHHINRSEIPNILKVYTLISKKKENHYMVDEMESTNTADFAMSMISHTAVPLGSDIELKGCDILYGPMAKMSIEEYFIETVGIIKLYVMMSDDVSPDEIIKRLAAARRCFSIACGRNIDDIKILNKVDEVDPYDTAANFESEVDRNVYRLTKKIRMMSKATHVLDMSQSYGFVLRNPCSVEREVCEKYNLNRIDVSMIDSVVRKMRKENDDLKIIMGKTECIGTPRPRFDPAYSPHSYFDGYPDPFGFGNPLL